MKHFCVIDPGCRVAEISNFNYLVRANGIVGTYHLPAIWGAHTLFEENFDDIQGVIIFGSGASIHEDLAWQEQLRSWLKEAFLRKIPTLGICYGHQLIAEMFGGKVRPVHADQHKMKGLRYIEAVSEGIFSGMKGQVVISHKEAVLEKPESMRCLASSRELEFDGLVHESLPIYSFQSHPEATMGFVANNEIPGVNPADLSFGHSLVKTFVRSAVSHTM